MKGLGRADEVPAAPERLRELCQLGHRGHALHRVEPVDHHQPRQVGAGERRDSRLKITERSSRLA